jgi:toxin-antitoxin system PIN domain toxin
LRALLDVNVLIALMDAAHAFHQRAHDWWGGQQRAGWASCPLVENGVIRIMSSPTYSTSRRLSVAEVTGAFRTFVAGTDHVFWPDSLSLRDSRRFAAERIHGGKQVTDIYLLALAAENHGVLATFDERIALSAAKLATEENLRVI